jgi:hypothetical protein
MITKPERAIKIPQRLSVNGIQLYLENKKKNVIIKIQLIRTRTGGMNIFFISYL